MRFVKGNWGVCSFLKFLNNYKLYFIIRIMLRHITCLWINSLDALTFFHEKNGIFVSNTYRKLSFPKKIPAPTMRVVTSKILRKFGTPWMLETKTNTQFWKSLSDFNVHPILTHIKENIYSFHNLTSIFYTFDTLYNQYLNRWMRALIL